MVTWVGDNSNFNEADNWSTNSLPTSADILLFTGPQTPVPPTSPPPMGTPPVLPPPYSYQSVTFPNTADLSYAGIHILNGYTGTVTFPANISFADYIQNSGYTSQSADTVVSVSTKFGWTGGAINTSTNAATMKLKGVLNAQIGEDTTSLSSGSKFLLDKNSAGVGSYVRQAGVLNQSNGALIEVSEDSTLDQRRINVNGNDPLEAGHIITNGHTYSNGGKVKSVKVNNVKGWLRMDGDGIQVTDKVSGYAYGVMMTAGKISLQCGGTLQATYGVGMTDGLFEATEDTAGNPSNTATIDGNFEVFGGTIRLTPANADRYTLLQVTSSLWLSSGLFDAGVKGTENLVSDRIRADAVTTSTTFKVKLTEKEWAAAAGKHWDLVKAVSVYYGTATDIPTADQPLLYSTAQTTDGLAFRMTRKP